MFDIGDYCLCWYLRVKGMENIDSAWNYYGVPVLIAYGELITFIRHHWIEFV